MPDHLPWYAPRHAGRAVATYAPLMADAPVPPIPIPAFPAAGITDADSGLRVRIWDPARDAPEAMRLYRDPANDRWGLPFFVPRLIDEFATRTRLDKQVEAARAGAPTSYAVVDADDRVLGDIGWRLDSPGLLIADLGYGTLPEARGRGVARTGLRLLSDWLLDSADGPGLPRAELDHAVANVASCKVAVGAGFAQEGVRTAYLPLYDPDVPQLWRRHDVCMHGRLSAAELALRAAE